MITLREEKLRMAPDIFVEKRDGRRVQFDVEKIYKALLKATEEVTSLTPVMEAKLEAIVDRVIAEILERFPNGVKIYEIQNVVEHELLQANEYAIAESCKGTAPRAANKERSCSETINTSGVFPETIFSESQSE